MTREIIINGRENQSRKVCAHTAAKKDVRMVGKICGTVVGVSSVYSKAVRVKREFFDRFVAFSEKLADRTAREGLFGEDKGKGYSGTDRDYISE